MHDRHGLAESLTDREASFRQLPAHSSVTTLTATSQQPPESPGAARSTSVVVVRDLQKLSSLIPAWEKLAEHALERNIFYEHWMLLPALQAYGAGEDIGVALVLTEGNRLGAGSLASLPLSSYTSCSPSRSLRWR